MATLSSPSGLRDFQLCADAAIRYEERELAIIRWCKTSVRTPERGQMSPGREEATLASDPNPVGNPSKPDDPSPAA